MMVASGLAQRMPRPSPAMAGACAASYRPLSYPLQISLVAERDHGGNGWERIGQFALRRFIL